MDKEAGTDPNTQGIISEIHIKGFMNTNDITIEYNLNANDVFTIRVTRCCDAET